MVKTSYGKQYIKGSLPCIVTSIKTVAITRGESQHHHHHNITWASTKKEKEKEKEKERESQRKIKSVEWQACTNRLNLLSPSKSLPSVKDKGFV